MKKILTLLGFLLVSAINPQKAEAYLDPGTGSMVIQAIIAGIVGAGCTIGVYKKKIIDFFKNLRNKNDK